MLTLKIMKSVYQNGDFSILKARVLNSDDDQIIERTNISIKGKNLPPIGNIKTEKYSILENKYGKTLDIHSFSEGLDQEEIVKRFLLEIKGIGNHLANNIWDYFEDETFEILMASVSNLKLVSGIKEKTFWRILGSLDSIRGAIPIYQTLSKYNVSPKESFKIHELLGSGASSKIRENPYVLYFKKIISFAMADRIALEFNFAENNPIRVRALILNALIELRRSKGDIFTPIAELENYFFKTLQQGKQISKNDFEERLREMRAKNEVKISKVGGVLVVYTKEAFEAEETISGKLAYLADAEAGFDSSLELAIVEMEKRVGFTLAPKQREAVSEAFSNAVSIITGGPGVGKTTVVNFICKIHQERYSGKILLCAPTGRAAKRMNESTGIQASTLHSALHLIPSDNESEYTRASKPEISDYDLVIVDEVSMLDVFLAKELVDAVKTGTRLVLIGDVDQLPSVGPGFVLSDLISSQKIKTTKLDQVYRQKRFSKIAINAQHIKFGSCNLEYDDTFEFYETIGTDDLVKTAIEHYKREINIHGIDNVALLSPFRQQDIGSARINKLIQDQINPSQSEIKVFGKIFRKGDKVLQTKNYNLFKSPIILDDPNFSSLKDDEG